MLTPTRARVAHRGLPERKLLLLVEHDRALVRRHQKALLGLLRSVARDLPVLLRRTRVADRALLGEPRCQDEVELGAYYLGAEVEACYSVPTFGQQGFPELEGRLSISLSRHTPTSLEVRLKPVGFAPRWAVQPTVLRVHLLHFEEGLHLEGRDFQLIKRLGQELLRLAAKIARRP